MVMREGEQRPGMFSFDQNAGIVARELIGATIHYGEGKSAVIREAEPFPTERIVDEFFQDAQDQPIGTLTRTDYFMRGQRVLSPNITVADRGLVMPTNLELPGKREGTVRHITSQSAIARELGLEQDVPQKLEIVDPVQKVLRLV